MYLRFILVSPPTTDKQSRSVSVQELISQFITFTFAGTDTTAELTLMACYVLAHDSALQDELREHVRERVADFASLCHDDLPRLEYLQAFINETLRLYPPAGELFPRQALRPMKIGKSESKLTPNRPIQREAGLHRGSWYQHDPEAP